MTQMIETPLISIIVSTLNDGKKLDETIKSFENQDYDFKELIIIDGNSSDTTSDIVKKNNHIVSTFLSENDEGIYDAWNKGISKCNGEWIGFLGAGDRFFDKKSISSLVQCIENNEINFISGIIFIDDIDKIFVNSMGKAWSIDALKNNINIGHPGALHHKSLFDTHGTFNKDYKICGDYEFLLRVRKQINSKFYPNYLVKMDNTGISNNKAFSAILESSKAIGHNIEFGIYFAIRFMVFTFIKTIIKKILNRFKFGKKVLQKMNEKKNLG